MSARDEYVAKMKAQLDQWNAELDELEAKAQKGKAQAQKQYAEQIAALRDKSKQAQGKLAELRNSASDTWENAKTEAEQMWQTLGDAIRSSKDAFLKEFRDN